MSSCSIDSLSRGRRWRASTEARQQRGDSDREQSPGAGHRTVIFWVRLFSGVVSVRGGNVLVPVQAEPNRTARREGDLDVEVAARVGDRDRLDRLEGATGAALELNLRLLRGCVSS